MFYLAFFPYLCPRKSEPRRSLFRGLFRELRNRVNSGAPNLFFIYKMEIHINTNEGLTLLGVLRKTNFDLGGLVEVPAYLIEFSNGVYCEYGLVLESALKGCKMEDFEEFDEVYAPPNMVVNSIWFNMGCHRIAIFTEVKPYK